jgi:glycosyltransferase involved in cell wall biosynthesis
MHVVQALVSLGIGGSEMVAVEITEYLRASGHRVTVIAAGGPLQSRVNRAGAQWLEWPIGRKSLGTLRFIRHLRTWIRQQKPDIVHVHSRFPAWICYLALRGLDDAERPVFITSMHGQYSVSAYSAVMARGDHVIAVSGHIRNYTLKNYLPAYCSWLHTVYGGTSRQDFPYGYRPSDAWWEALYDEFPELRGRRVLLLPGRLSRYKGHAAFIEMLAALQTRYEDIHGVILGEARPGSRYVNELEGLAERYGVGGRLTFCGLRTDMRDWMAASHLVFNLCSDPPEAFGRIATECLSLGVPLVAWNHGGVREILQQMFPVGAVTPDDVIALIEKTADFLEQRPVVRRSEAFSLRESMDQTLQLYQSALGKERG